MPPEIDALIAKPELLAAVLAVGAAFGIAIALASPRTRYRKWRGNRRWQRRESESLVSSETKLRESAAPKPSDAADQLRIVLNAQFRVRRILNKSEARVFDELKQAVMGCDATWHVMAQVSLGEILRCEDREAFGCINSKRVDLLLVDADCMPRYAIEYQGKAHHQGAAAARDAVKKEALRRAGVGYYEVVAGQTTPAELRRLVGKLISPSGASSP